MKILSTTNINNIRYTLKHSYVIFILIIVTMTYAIYADMENEIEHSRHNIEILNTEYDGYLDRDYFCKSVGCEYVGEVGEVNIINVDTYNTRHVGYQINKEGYSLLDKLYYRLIYKNDIYFLNMNDNIISVIKPIIFLLLLYIVTISIIIKRVIFDGRLDNIDNIKKLEYMHKYEVIHGLASNINHEVTTPLNVIKSITAELEYTAKNAHLEIAKVRNSMSCSKESLCELIEESILETNENILMLNTAVEQIYTELNTLKEYKNINVKRGEDSTIYNLITLAFKMVNKTALNTTTSVSMNNYTISEEFKTLYIDSSLGMNDMLLMTILINHIKNSIEAKCRNINIVYSEGYIKIIDDGIGIPKDIQNSIFLQDFTTKSNKTDIRGNGLYINRMLLNEKYDSDIILLESIPNVNTVFCLKIKLERKENVKKDDN